MKIPDDEYNDNDRRDEDSRGSKYDEMAGTEGSGDSKYDEDLASRQDQSNEDQQEQQGADEEI